MIRNLMHTPGPHTLPPPVPKALIADDQPDVLTALRLQELLSELLTEDHRLPAAELRDRIMGAVNEFSDGEVYDDATLMIVKVD
ncbi:MAG: hypothetical protein ABJC05_06775 [Pyrinomonadaceae bacterium]